MKPKPKGKLPPASETPKVDEWRVRYAIREFWPQGVHVWEWRDAPDLFYDFNPFDNDARRCALVPRDVWDGWLDEDCMPWWMMNLGGTPDETTGIPNFSWHILADKWVLAIGAK